MTSKWRERLYSPSWSTGERVYVIVLWLIILGSLLLLFSCCFPCPSLIESCL